MDDALSSEPIEPIEPAKALELADVLAFKLGDDGKLLAVVKASEAKPLLDVETVKERLAGQGLCGLFLDDHALLKLIKQYNSSHIGFELEIGERRDATVAVKIDADRMAAKLTITPPYGGAPVSVPQVKLALKESGVVFGIIANEIKAAIQEGHAKERIIAKGLPAVRGFDARFQSLIPEIRERKPRVDQYGNVDYRDLGGLIFVRKGDPLMCRTPPTEGRKGRDVTGQILMPKAGQDIAFAAGLQGVEFDQADTALDPDHNMLLLAAITGQPKLVANGVIVEPTVNLPLVDISTGNVDFDGTLNIKGDVKDGMKVHATGDVFVGGTVEAAEISADGNVVIKGGVIGHSEHTVNPNEEPVFYAKITSKGSISARFVENAYIESDVDIIIDELAMHSHLIALNQILVGKSAKKGHIIGGIAIASKLLKTGIIGSNAGFITKLRAGFNPRLQAQMDKLKVEIAAIEKELEDIKKIIAFFMAHPEKDKNGMLNKALHTREPLEADCARLHVERSHVLAEINIPENVQITAEVAVHSGAEIQIGEAVWKNTQERGKGVFHIVDGEIDFGDIMQSISA